MIRLDCPRCGQPNEVQHLGRSADEFCTNCDYPLFWAELDSEVADVAFSGAGLLDQSVRRLPGTAGRVDVEGEPCRRCGERNRPNAVFCSRCGIELHPAPQAPPIPEITPPIAPVVASVPQRTPENHLLLLAAIISVVVALILLAGIQLGAGWLNLTLVMLCAILGGLIILEMYRRGLRRGPMHDRKGDNGEIRNP
jgi:hypothetical protein